MLVPRDWPPETLPADSPARHSGGLTSVGKGLPGGPVSHQGAWHLSVEMRENTGFLNSGAWHLVFWVLWFRVTGRSGVLPPGRFLSGLTRREKSVAFRIVKTIMGKFSVGGELAVNHSAKAPGHVA